MLLLHLGLPDSGTLTSLGPWLGLAALGAFHGLNPGMGWLFALALGLQRRSEWAIVRALVFITAGHAASVLLVASILLLIGSIYTPQMGPSYLGQCSAVLRDVQTLQILSSPQVGGDAGGGS